MRIAGLGLVLLALACADRPSRGECAQAYENVSRVLLHEGGAAAPRAGEFEAAFRNPDACVREGAQDKVDCVRRAVDRDELLACVAGEK